MLCLLQCFWLKSLINKFHNCRTRSITGTLKAYLLGPYRPNPLPISHFFPLGSPFYPFLPYRVPCQHFSPLYGSPSSPFPPSKAPLLPLTPLLGSSSSFLPSLVPFYLVVPLRPSHFTPFLWHFSQCKRNIWAKISRYLTRITPKRCQKCDVGGDPVPSSISDPQYLTMTKILF